MCAMARKKGDKDEILKQVQHDKGKDKRKRCHSGPSPE